ncbi:MAG: ArgE/DapE family deacylase [Alphaproteobacteria bacterium]|nr:ArgE/DapE family deacylase [Alphaproteobacteria bacterium]
MSDRPSAIAARVDALHEAQIRFLAELVKAPSDNPPGDCAAAAEHAAELLTGLGYLVERHAVPDELVAQNGMKSCVNLIVRRQFGPGPVIALNAHGDVVPPGEGWTRDPYGADIVDGWMYGRGVAVSKSDIATYAYALKALEDAALPRRGTVELHITYDEEAGGEIGPRYLLERELSRPDLAIGAGFSYAVVTAHNGCLHLEIEVRGRSAHAAMPTTGVDALEAATKIMTALYRLRAKLAETQSAIAGIGSPALTIGLISGGINTNVVPDRVVFRLDRRIIPDERPETVETELRQAIEKATPKAKGLSVNVRRILLAEPLRMTAESEQLALTICRHASSVLGETVQTTGVPLYTDARHYSRRGVPIVLYGAGPRTITEANAHRADERLKLEDLRAATKVVALSLAELLGG